MLIIPIVLDYIGRPPHENKRQETSDDKAMFKNGESRAHPFRLNWNIKIEQN